MGIFGNPASIIIDVNLIIQWVIFVFLLVGYLNRSDLKTHGLDTVAEILPKGGHSLDLLLIGP